MHFFVLDRPPQPFDENVVHEAARSVHRNHDAGRHKGLLVKASAVKVEP